MGRILCRHYKNPIKNIGIEPEKSWFFVHIIQIMPLHFVVIYGMMKKIVNELSNNKYISKGVLLWLVKLLL